MGETPERWHASTSGVEPRRRPPLVGMAVVVGCLGVFIANLWVPVLDGLDTRFPVRERVAERAGPPVRWEVTLDRDAVDNQEVHEALAVLSPSYRELVDHFGGSLVLTTEDALSHVPTALQPELSHTTGVYVPSRRVAYIAHDAGEPGWTVLHELGHMLDHALGGLSQQPTFADIYERLRTDTRMSGYARTHPRECFAELFARFYFSDRRRRHLEARFPRAARYMVELEQRILDGAPGEKPR